MARIQLAIEIKTYDLKVLQKPQKIRFILTMELTSQVWSNQNSKFRY